MRRTLNLHPDSRCDAVTLIEVDVERPGPYALELRYRLTGAMNGVRLPPSAAPDRADELWRHTCLEAFVRAPDDEGYYEFNFAPSTQWAAYRFSSYRDGMRVVDNIAAPRIETQAADDGLTLQVSLSLEPLPGERPWRLGLSAVIEEASGRKSYWALAHPPGAADFHHADGLVLVIAPPARPLNPERT